LQLRDQLQATLTGSYTIERKLGGGGMSKVFVAEETRLRRKVVVKVLSPELAQGISVERFEREKQTVSAAIGDTGNRSPSPSRPSTGGPRRAACDPAYCHTSRSSPGNVTSQLPGSMPLTRALPLASR